MAISPNQKPTIYRNLYKNTDPDLKNLPGFFSKTRKMFKTLKL